MSELEEISRWVNENGYPLEMRVARELRVFDCLYVEQSHYLADLETGKMREVDVFASWGYISSEEGPEDREAVFTDLVVECKDIPHSWVLFQDGQSELNEIPRTVLALNAIPCRLPENEEPDGWEYQIFPIDDRVPEFLQGVFNPCYAIKQKSVGQKKAEHSDPAYNAVRKIGEAAVASVEPVSAGYHRCIPAVVTTADIFVCQLAREGEIEIVKVDRSSVRLKTPHYDETIEVHVLQESALHQFVAEVAELAERFAEEPEHRNRD